MEALVAAATTNGSPTTMYRKDLQDLYMGTTMLTLSPALELKSSAFRRFQQMSPVSLCDFDPSPPASDVRGADAADTVSPDSQSQLSPPLQTFDTPSLDNHPSSLTGRLNFDTPVLPEPTGRLSFNTPTAGDEQVDSPLPGLQHLPVFSLSPSPKVTDASPRPLSATRRKKRLSPKRPVSLDLSSTTRSSPLRTLHSKDLPTTTTSGPVGKHSPTKLTGHPELEDETSQDSGVSMGDHSAGTLPSNTAKCDFTGFKFPLGPAPRRVRILSQDCLFSPTSESPSPLKSPLSSPLRPISAPPSTNLNFSPTSYLSQKSVRDSPLKFCPLVSSPEDVDETSNDDLGFSELLSHSASQQQDTSIPSGLSSLLTAPMVTPNKLAEQGLSLAVARRGLFRSPSAPWLMGERAHTFNMGGGKRMERESSDTEDTEDTADTASCQHRPQVKRRRSVVNSSPSLSQPQPVIVRPKPVPVLQRCQSELAIKTALRRQDSSEMPLIGDCTREHSLPICPSKHQDLKGISPDTMAGLLRGEFSHSVEKFAIVDCRYPYEFEGGHIHEARNLYTKEEIYNTFINGSEFRSSSESSGKSNILIFHCEFSSERGPKMSRFVRNKDRDDNKENYPHLHYPEMYILEGGYKAFWEQHPELCTPEGAYKPMLHKDHSEDLKHFRTKSKSWSGDSKCGPVGGRGMARHKSRTASFKKRMNVL